MLIFRVVAGVYRYPTKFSPHSSRFSQTKNAGLAVRLAKKRPHPLTRSQIEKRVTNLKIFEGEIDPAGVSVGKPYTQWGQNGV